jgi:hypothetical protein
MKNIGCFLLAVLVFFVVPAPAGPVQDKDPNKQVLEILAEWVKITPGTTRAELLKVYTTEGGLSTATHRTYVHRRCCYIKVDVEFTLSEPKQGAVEERPTDTIKKITRPYLYWTISD